MSQSLTDRLLTSQMGRALMAMNPAMRVAVLGGGAATVLALVAVGWWASRPSYVRLANELDYTQSALVIRALDEAKIAHRTEAGGTEIMVDQARFAEARIALAEADVNLTNAKSGLEVFNEPHWAWTDFSEKVNYRSALEGELATSIERQAGVRSARVHITLPETMPFRRVESRATASVILEIEGGATPSRESVQGIKYLVASSVERLKADDVSVLDTEGRVLSAPAATGALALADKRLEYQRSVERDVATKIETLLARVVGEANVRVQVSAAVGFDQVRRRSEDYDTEGQVILSQQTVDVEGGEASPPLPASSASATTNYQNPRAIEEVEKATGTIERLSIAVILNESEGEEAPDVARVEDLVKGAAGFDATRGDQVVVRTIAFETAPVHQATGRDWMGIVQNNVRYAIGLVAFALLYLLGKRILRLLATSAPVVAARTPAPAQTAVAEPEPFHLPPAPEPTVEQKRYLNIIQEARARTSDSNEAGVRVIKSWLNESK